MENSIGNYISCGRNVRGLTLRELASELDLDVVTLTKIEKNYRQFPKGKLQLLANIFNVSLDEILVEFLKTDLYNSYGEFQTLKDLS